MDDFKLGDSPQKSATTTVDQVPMPFIQTEPIRSEPTPIQTPYAPARPTPNNTPVAPRQTFPMLRLVMTAYRVMAGIVAVSWLLMTIIIIGMLVTGALTKMQSPGGAIVGALFTWVFISFGHIAIILLFLTAAESVELGLCIERNTYAAAHGRE